MFKPLLMVMLESMGSLLDGSCPNRPRNLSNSISPSSIPSGAMQQGDLFWLTFPAPFQDQQPYTFLHFPGSSRKVGNPQPHSPGEDSSLFPQGTCGLKSTH